MANYAMGDVEGGCSKASPGPLIGAVVHGDDDAANAESGGLCYYGHAVAMLCGERK